MCKYCGCMLNTYPCPLFPTLHTGRALASILVSMRMLPNSRRELLSCVAPGEKKDRLLFRGEEVYLL